MYNWWHTMKTINYITCIFVKEGISAPQSSPMPDVQYHTIESGLQYIASLQKIGLSKFLIFGILQHKSIEAGCNGIVPFFVREARRRFGSSITIIADVGLSPHREDGHSTILVNCEIDEKASYDAACELAVAFARAGVDAVAPCLSLKYQVEKIRTALDENKFQLTQIMAYSAKFSSSLYGPYRAVITSPLGATKKNYQTDYSDKYEALRQIALDEFQKADVVMVKPATMYLDIVFQARQLTQLPLAVYHVSGEYAMIKCAAKAGMIDEQEAFDEVHTAFERCGVNLIIGYAPEHFVRWRDQAESK